jgi:hypothetical protein
MFHAFTKGPEKRKGGFVPDFEIRYFDADGTLGVIRVTMHNTLARAEEHARAHQGSYARFEVREVKGSTSR